MHATACAPTERGDVTTRGDERPWGRYEVLDGGPGYQVKRLEVRPGRRLSHQWHAHRAEHWTVVRGTAEVTVDGRTWLVPTGGCVCVPQTSPHRLANRGESLLVVIEVQHGDYLGEDDIVRLDDDFGRTT